MQSSNLGQNITEIHFSQPVCVVDKLQISSSKIKFSEDLIEKLVEYFDLFIEQ